MRNWEMKWFIFLVEKAEETEPPGEGRKQGFWMSWCSADAQSWFLGQPHKNQDNGWTSASSQVQAQIKCVTCYKRMGVLPKGACTGVNAVWESGRGRKRWREKRKRKRRRREERMRRGEDREHQRATSQPSSKDKVGHTPYRMISHT